MTTPAMTLRAQIEAALVKIAGVWTKADSYTSTVDALLLLVEEREAAAWKEGHLVGYKSGDPDAPNPYRRAT